MKFLCLVYFEEGTLAALSPSEKVSLDRDSLAYDKELSRSGHYVVSDALASVRTARTVRVRRGKATTTDGPFAETKEQLLGLLRLIAECKLDGSERGCALANAAIQLPDRNHPARRVIEEYKSLHHDKIIGLCRRAGLRDPELLADELFLLGEGARVSLQSLGPRGPAERLTEMFQTLVAAHTPP